MPSPLANETVSPTPAAPEAPRAPTLPSPFLDVASGQVPAVSVPPIVGSTYTEAQKFLVENFDKVLDAGIDYAELDGDISVFYNPKLLTEKEIKAAASSGKLPELAPPVDKLGAPPSAPAPAASPGAPAAAAQPANPAPGPLAGMTVTPSAGGPQIDRKVQSARLANTKAPKPDAPGAGPLPALQKRAL